MIESSFDAVQTIIACSIHQKRIVDDILTLSKLDSRLLLITPTRVKPVSLVQDAINMLKAEALVADVQLHYREDEPLGKLGVDWVMMDSSLVLQVFVNLLTNAIKFTRTEATRAVSVTIKAAKERPKDTEGYIPVMSEIKDLTNLPE
jgi:signal transduction histidine kinase